MQPLRVAFADAVAAGDHCDLAQAALVVARIGDPDVDPAPSLAVLDGLADAIRPRLAFLRTPDDRALTITHYLFSEQGFRGNQDAYYDPRNSFLNEVLARRTGIPITLSLVVMEVAKRLDVAVDGIGFPGHFLVRVPTPRGGIVLDPFFGGRTVSERELLDRLAAAGPERARRRPQLDQLPPELLRPVPPQALLARMLRNLLHIYLDTGDRQRALFAVDLALLLAPEAAPELKTRGVLYTELDCPAAAAEDFRRYLELAPEAPDAEDVRRRLARLADATPTLH